MDGECAFCGRAETTSTRRVFCGDCQSEHRVCVSCSDEIVLRGPSRGSNFAGADLEPEPYYLVA